MLARDVRFPFITAAAFAPEPGLFEDLFLKPRGLVSITAASLPRPGVIGQAAEGEAAWSSESGGLFTQTFLNLYREEQARKRKEGIKTITWNAFFPKLQMATERSFAAFKLDATKPINALRVGGPEKVILSQQRTQLPEALSLPD